MRQAEPENDGRRGGGVQSRVARQRHQAPGLGDRVGDEFGDHQAARVDEVAQPPAGEFGDDQAAGGVSRARQGGQPEFIGEAVGVAQFGSES